MTFDEMRYLRDYEPAAWEKFCEKHKSAYSHKNSKAYLMNKNRPSSLNKVSRVNVSSFKGVDTMVNNYVLKENFYRDGLRNDDFNFYLMNECEYSAYIEEEIEKCELEDNSLPYSNLDPNVIEFGE